MCALHFRPFTVAAACLLAALLAPVAATAETEAQPLSETRADALAPLAELQRVAIPALDVPALLQEDTQREAAGLPPRYAVPHAVDMTPDAAGRWETVDDQRVWRLRVGSPGALSINLGFGRYVMPAGGRLHVYSPDFKQRVRPFTAKDNAAHGELWTPPLASDEVVIEVVVPAGAERQLQLKLTSINPGYRDFGIPGVSPQSGACNVDVVCPEGDGWRSEIPSVGAISTGGSIFCTGFMVNNTAQDQTPYFMTARHCSVTSSNAASLVVYWNYETSVCDGTPDGSLGTFQSGAFWRAAYSPSDFTLVELDELPNPAWGVTYSGWNRSSGDAPQAIAIHHPSGDEKRISFEYEPTTTTTYLGTSIPGDGTHVRVADWDEGTTEPGSSGSPLYDQNHQVIGQLHGGYAACGNDDADWYGRFSVSWTGGGTASSRLSDWLDPLGTGQMSLGTLGGAPAVVYDDHVLDDGAAGNGDGIADPGETFDLRVTARNVGGEDASGIAGTLGSAAEEVTVNSAVASWPDLVSQQSAESAAPYFNVTLDPATVCGSSVPLELHFTANEVPGSWNSSFSVPVGVLAGDAVSFEDDMESGANGWTEATPVGSNVWSQTTAHASSPVTSWWVDDISSVSDSVLVAPVQVDLPPNTVLRFQHRVATEANYDGGVLEYSTDGGAIWTDAGSLITAGGYGGAISTSYSSPIGGRNAWHGSSGGWTGVEADLSSLAGSDLTLRWRFATDSSVSSDGWYVDDVELLVNQFDCNPAQLAPPGEALELRIDEDPLNGYALSWSAPASGGPVTDYVLYAMPIGDPGADPSCEASLGSGTTAVVAALPADSRFLVVARNAAGEGSYGQAADGSPRPPATSACP